MDGHNIKAISTTGSTNMAVATQLASTWSLHCFYIFSQYHDYETLTCFAHYGTSAYNGNVDNRWLVKIAKEGYDCCWKCY